MVVDRHKDRVQLAEKAGAIAIDDIEGHGVEKIMDLTGGKGAGVFLPEGSGRERQAREARRVGIRLWPVLVKGAEHGHGPGQRQSLQPTAEPAD